MVTLAERTARNAGRPKKIPGEAGIWIFIFGDMTIFAVCFLVYILERSKQPELFDASQETLNRNFGALNTIVLLLSSLFVVLAVHQMRAAHEVTARLMLIAAFLCGVTFVAVKAFEYHERIAAGQTPTTNSFYLLYFVLTGLHLFHLILGLGVLVALWLMGRKPMSAMSSNQWGFFEGAGCFWHMVDLLWLVLFPLIFLVR
jgi:nitric oxide reductase NorE protein